jgi:hypothetical protein
MAQAIAYQLSFIDGGVSSGLVGIAARLWSVTEIASVAQASLSALVAPLQNIASAWSGREQQLNNISRSLRQYGYVGQTVAEINRDITRSMPGATEAQRSAQFTEVYQRQFNDARQFSRGIVRQMSKDAALLPGELNDYLQTFSVALPHMPNERLILMCPKSRHGSPVFAQGNAKTHLSFYPDMALIESPQDMVYKNPNESSELIDMLNKQPTQDEIDNLNEESPF